MTRTRWLSIVCGIALSSVLGPACKRTPAKAGDYEWMGGGESGAPGVEPLGSQGGAGSSHGGTGGGKGGADSETEPRGGGAGMAGAASNGGSGAAAGDAAGHAGKPAGGGSGGGDGPGPQNSGGESDSGGPAGEGGAGGDASDPCADAPDTDGDGLTDPCDDDDDDDGYLDLDDAAPLDPGSPGGLAAPGTIVNDACVKDVLAELDSLGLTMPIHREQFPPNMDGYYVRAAGTATIAAANDGATVGVSLYGMEARLETVGRERFDAAVIEFWGGQAISTSIGHDGLIRGRGNDFTHYGATGGMIVMYSATRGPTGNWLDGRYLSILLPMSGMPHSACPAGAGLYRFSSAPLISKVLPDALDFMCLDEGRGYVPSERWTRESGDLCDCTSTYQVSCVTP